MARVVNTANKQLIVRNNSNAYVRWKLSPHGAPCDAYIVVMHHAAMHATRCDATVCHPR